MLVLSRKEGEEIVVGDNIVVVVREVKGGRVILGIKAPPEVPVLRAELVEGGHGRDRPETGKHETDSPPGFGDLPATEVTYLPSTQEIAEIVGDEVARLGGTVSRSFAGHDAAYVRAVLPMTTEVRPNDVFHGGFAVKTIGKHIEIRHYLLRKVCTNGAIGPACEGRRVSRVEFTAPPEAIAKVKADVRAAISACGSTSDFSTAIQPIREAAQTPVNLTGPIDPRIAPLLKREEARIQAEIRRRFERQRDATLYGLMNAMTSVARDQRDPEIRWRLEELGGSISSLILSARPTRGAVAKFADVHRSAPLAGATAQEMGDAVKRARIPA